MSVPNPAPAPAPVDLIVSQPSTPVSINTTNFVPVSPNNDLCHVVARCEHTSCSNHLASLIILAEQQ